MVAAIVHAGDLMLRQVAAPIPLDQITAPETRAIVEALRLKMTETEGVGLAAPQIGMWSRIVLVQDLALYHEAIPEERLREREREPIDQYILINPEIHAVGSEERTFLEGCLSVEGFQALVPRQRRVAVTYYDESGARQQRELAGWHARILQHEIDHLNGVLYVDRMLPRSLMSQVDVTERWGLQSADAVVKAFDALRRPPDPPQ